MGSSDIFSVSVNSTSALAAFDMLDFLNWFPTSRLGSTLCKQSNSPSECFAAYQQLPLQSSGRALIGFVVRCFPCYSAYVDCFKPLRSDWVPFLLQKLPS